MATSNNSNSQGIPKSHGNICYPPMAVVSNGILQGDIPLNFALPLLIVQIALVLLVTRTMGILFRPIKQPRVLAEIIGGVVLGPTALGRNELYLKTIFPPQSMPLLETVANMGLMFFIFMVGLGLDLDALRKTGKHALLVALIGIAVPLTASIGVAELVRKTISKGVRLVPLVVFLGAPISMSAFSVLVRILAELKMLNTDIAKLAVPSGALNDVVIWTLLAVGVATAGPASDQASALTPIWVLLCGAAYGLIMLTVVRKLMRIVAERAVNASRAPGGRGSELYVCMTLMAVLLAGLVSDGIGVHPVVGPFLLGLVIPKGNEFPRMMTEKMEDMVTGLLVPLFFASSGLKTNLGALHGTTSIAFLILFFATAATGKIVATFVTGRLIGLNTRQAFILGFLMNTKGLAVLIVLNIGRDLKVLTDETFAILVVTCLLTSFVTTPMVITLCKPLVNDGDMCQRRRSVEEVTTGAMGSEQKKRKEGLCILACRYESRQPVAPISNTTTSTTTTACANLLEAMRGSIQATCPIKIYALCLLDLADRPSTLLDITNIGCPSDIPGPSPSNTPPFLPFVFPSSPLLHKPTIHTFATLSVLDSMDEDILKVASKKRASLILLPYHRPSHHLFHNGFNNLNQKVLDHAPCSVAILVDPVSMEVAPSFFAFSTYKVTVLFIGGHDDREALAISSRMLDHPGVTLRVIRMVSPSQAQHDEMAGQNLAMGSLKDSSTFLDEPKEKILDDDAISNFKGKASQDPFVYEEVMLRGQTLLEGVKAITKDMNDVNLFIVGRGSLRSRLILGVTDQCQSECKELGVVGDALLSMGHDRHACLLVVQQHPSCIDTKIQTLRKPEFP